MHRRLRSPGPEAPSLTPRGGHRMLRITLGITGAALATVLVAACNGTSTSSTPTPTDQSSAPADNATSLPFQYQARGESSSPSFHVTQAAKYAVTYHLAGDPQQPSCNVRLI